MSTGIISARNFADGNKLFNVLLHKDGDDKKSYKTRNQLYVMECSKCLEQVEQRGNAKFECRRCRRFVSPVIGDDGKIKWKIDESSLKDKKVIEALKNPPKVFFKDGKYIEVEAESEDEEEDEEVNIPTPVKKSIPKGDEMIDFLKAMAVETGNKSKDRPKKKKVEAVAEDNGDDIDEEVVESIIPKKKEKTVLPKKPVEHCPVVSDVQMKVITLKPGQTYFCKELNTLFVGATE